jgi:hypothetical protein
MEPHWSRSLNSGSQGKSVHPLKNTCENEPSNPSFHQKFPKMARVKRLEDNALECIHRQSPRDGQRAVEQAHRRHCLRPNLDGSSFRRARRRPIYMS